MDSGPTGPLEESPKARLLIVDDEPHIRSSLTRALSLMGYTTEGAGSGQEALSLLERGSYDLMLLDMHLPGLNGLEVMQQAHHICPGLIIIILTGHATLDSAIAAVKSREVVDYLLKPASVHQVAAAVNAALQQRAEQLERERLVRTISEAVDSLRQNGKPAPSTRVPAPEREPLLRSGRLKLDLKKRLLVVEEDPARTVELTEGEATVLAALMERPEQVFSCRELARLAWGWEVEEGSARGPIRSCIFRLRQKIELDAGKPRLIRTVRSRGYLFSPGQDQENAGMKIRQT